MCTVVLLFHRERERERERERINSGEEKQEKILNEKFQTQISFLN
jgi:hypothetical protein